MIELLFGRSWRTLVWRGLAGTALGAVLLVWPAVSLDVLVYLFGAFALLDGALLVSAGVSLSERPSARALLVAAGLLGLSLGGLALIWPRAGALTLLFLIAARAIVIGTAELATALWLRRHLDEAWLLALVGVISFAFGAALLAYPSAGLLVLVLLLGAYALAVGIIQLAVAVLIRTWTRTTALAARTHEPTAADGLRRTAQRAKGTMTMPALAVLALLTLVSFSIGLLAAPHVGAAPSPLPPASDAPVRTPRNGVPMSAELFRDVARRENPAVVFITTESRLRELDSSDEEHLLREFFGLPAPRPRERVQRALGSGFLISREGEILTNNHVVDGADTIQVGLFDDDSRTFEATVVGRDPISDSALLKLRNPPAGLTAASLGDSDDLEPGDWVMAIGNPYQLGHTVTVGIVSYKGRPFQTSEGRWQQTIQTDASINPGNSGGPLINVRGDVVGINTAILARDESGGNVGIGFAVPINTVKALLPQLRAGRVIRGRIGVQTRARRLTENEAAALKLPKPEGVVVMAVEPDSPAERAGVQPGDVITSYNGVPIQAADELVARVAASKPGTQAHLTVIRAGSEMQLDVTVEELSLDAESRQSRSGTPAGGLGLSLGDLTPDLTGTLQLPAGVRGALVTAVEAGSPADEAGLQPGDVVTEVDRRPVSSASAAAAVLRTIKAGGTAFLLVWRQGTRLFLELHRA